MAYGNFPDEKPKTIVGPSIQKQRGGKRQELVKLLERANKPEAVGTLDLVFEVANRNGWIHGHILNPDGDFSRLTRLRVTAKNGDIQVKNVPVSLDESPFAEFYKAFGECQHALGVTDDECNDYITRIQAT